MGCWIPAIDSDLKSNDLDPKRLFQGHIFSIHQLLAYSTWEAVSIT